MSTTHQTKPSVPSPIGEKRPKAPSVTPTTVVKKQRTTSGYQQIFSDISNTPHTSPDCQQTPPRKPPVPLPLNSPTLPPGGSPKPSYPTKNPSGSSYPSPSAPTPALSTLNLAKELEFLRGQISKLQTEHESITKGQQSRIQFLETQLEASNEERRTLSSTLHAREREHVKKVEQLYESLPKNQSQLLPSHGPDSSPFPEEPASSQESFQALCLTQHVPPVRRLAQTSESPQQRLELIKYVMECSEEEIRSFANGELTVKQIRPSPVPSLPASPDLQQRINSLERDNTCLEQKLQRKEEEKARAMEQCLALSVQKQKLHESKELLREKAKIMEKKCEEKIQAMKNLAYELKEHIESQQQEIQSLKRQLRAKDKKSTSTTSSPRVTSPLPERSIPTASTGLSSPTSSPTPSPRSPTPSPPKADLVGSPSQEHSSPPLASEKRCSPTPDVVMQEIQEEEEIICPASPEPESEEVQPSLHEFGSSPVKSARSVSFALRSQSAASNSDLDDSDEEIEQIQPILSVEDYANEAYRSASSDAGSTEQSPASSQSLEESKEQEDLSEDEKPPSLSQQEGTSMSLSQEMDSILGMSQYTRDSSSELKKKFKELYGFSSSPMKDFAADPTVREASTLSALYKLERQASQ